MTPAPYTKDLPQQTTAEYLVQELGWESVYVYDEDFEPDSVLGRKTNREVVLTRILRIGIVMLNPGRQPLEKWLAIDFTDDHDGCLFTATVHRKAAN